VKLASLYLEGELLLRNYAEAKRWLEKAAYEGSPDAQGLLAEMFENGQGVDVDFVTAYAWYSVCYLRDRQEKPKLALERIEKEMTATQINSGQELARQLQSEISRRELL